MWLMFRRAGLIGIAFAVSACVAANAAPDGGSEHPAQTAASQIAAKVTAYLHSIDDADTAAGALVWANTADVSFINPRGSERGWVNIAANFYTKTMGESFTKRTLTRVGDLVIKVYGIAAVVEFNWDFVATRRDNGQPLHTTGRESQVYVDFPNLGWRLVHVHYSGPPTTGAGQGF